MQNLACVDYLETQCVKCRKRKAGTIQPIMSELPKLNVSKVSNHPLFIREWVTLVRFTFELAETARKDGDLFFLFPRHQGCTPRDCTRQLRTAVLYSSRFVVHQARSNLNWQRPEFRWWEKKEASPGVNNWNGMDPTIITAPESLSSKA